ncbi:MAG: phosphoribosyltransferase [Roseburia inulinivorans]
MSVSSYGIRHEVQRCGEDREGSIEPALKDKNVIVVEDIIDTGRTLSYLLENLKTRSPKTVTSVYTSWTSRNAEWWMSMLIMSDLDIPDEFVVGYGLDYDQQYRNLPYIGVVEIEE